MYVVALTNSGRVVLVKTSGAPIKAKTFYKDLGVNEYVMNDVALPTDGVELKVGKVTSNATTLKVDGVAHKIPTSLTISGYTHYVTALVEVPNAPLNAKATDVKINGN